MAVVSTSQLGADVAIRSRWADARRGAVDILRPALPGRPARLAPVRAAGRSSSCSSTCGATPADPHRGLGDFLTGPSALAAAGAGIYQGLRGTFWIGIVIVLHVPARHRRRHLPRGVRPAEPADALHRHQHPQPGRRARRSSTGSSASRSSSKPLGDFTGGRERSIAAGDHPRHPGPADRDHHSAEAIRAVPDEPPGGRLRRGRHSVGGHPHHVLPYAAPGILTGTVLALARALGEAAPLILVGAIDRPARRRRPAFLRPRRSSRSGSPPCRS